MPTVFDGVRDYAQHNPLSVAALLVIVVPGSYFYIIWTSPLPEVENTVLSQTFPSASDIARAFSLKHTVPIPRLSDRPSATFTHGIIENIRDNIKSTGIKIDECVGNNWTLHFSFCRSLSVAITATLPGFFTWGSRHFPDSWASRHQVAIANVLHFIALVSSANHRLGALDLLVVVLVMVAFDVFQWVLGREAADATNGSESEQQHQAPPASAGEILLVQTHSVLAESDFAHHPSNGIVESGDIPSILASPSGVSDTKPPPIDSKEGEIVRLQQNLAELETTNKAKEVQLRSAKEELRDAREALNETIAEYSSLCEELTTVKQTLGKDHQAIVYRKDIELFALRKANARKEKYIKDRDAKLDDKDAQLKILRDRLTSVGREASPQPGQDNMPEEGGDHALEVRLLRVKKGRDSAGSEQEKDVMIAKLREDLAMATKTAEAVVNQRAELLRAWDVAKKIQSALTEEKEQHIQTREQLQEAVVKLSEIEGQRKNRTNFNGRLPTIDEHQQDARDLEALFHTAQEDNLRLYAEVETLEKRLRDANARMFAAQQDAETLREQVRLEKAINEDLETARPSVIHRVHFQRMEGELKESRDAVLAKDEEVQLLRNTIVEKDHLVNGLQGEVGAAVNFHTQDQNEIERLKITVSELQATKEQLMLDHERLALHRTRQRIVSADRTSARSSDATLIQDLSPQLTRPSEEPASVEAMRPMPSSAGPKSKESIQQTPKKHLRSVSTPNRWSLVSNDVPPAELGELKASRRKSHGFKDLMKRMVRKDEKSLEDKTNQEAKVNENDRLRMRSAIASRDRNPPLRPRSAAPTFTAVNPVFGEVVHTPTSTTAGQKGRPSSSMANTSGYSTTDGSRVDKRPTTAAVDDATRPVSRRSWAATTKLKRRSLY